MSGAFDQLRLQLLWNRLIAVVEEQAQTLIRTAFSTTVREAGDLSAGVFDTKGRMLAQAVTGTPGHVNAMAASVGAFLKKYPLVRLEEGDGLRPNGPWEGPGHLNDFTVVTPGCREGVPIALFAAHPARSRAPRHRRCETSPMSGGSASGRMRGRSMKKASSFRSRSSSGAARRMRRFSKSSARMCATLWRRSAIFIRSQAATRRARSASSKR